MALGVGDRVALYFHTVGVAGQGVAPAAPLFMLGRWVGGERQVEFDDGFVAQLHLEAKGGARRVEGYLARDGPAVGGLDGEVEIDGTVIGPGADGARRREKGTGIVSRECAVAGLPGLRRAQFDVEFQGVTVDLRGDVEAAAGEEVEGANNGDNDGDGTSGSVEKADATHFGEDEPDWERDEEANDGHEGEKLAVVVITTGAIGPAKKSSGEEEGERTAGEGSDRGGEESV